MLSEVWSLFIERNDFFIKLLIEHIEISLICILIAIIFGGIVGILISEYNKFSKYILSLINFIYTIPSISMLGFLIPLFGIGNLTAIIALSLYALLPMVRNTFTGISSVEPSLIEAALGMGSTKFQILYKVKLPLAFSVINSGIRNMVVMTIALTGIASFIGAGGLGVAIYRGITTNNTQMTIVGSLLIAILALTMDFLLGFMENRMQKTKKITKKLNFSLIILLILIIISIASFFVKSSSKETLNIATKPMTEQYIMGEMLKILIEKDTNLKVNLTQGVGGGTSNIMSAMLSGEFDLYPEYTGTGWNIILKKQGLYTEDLFDLMQKNFNENFDMQWIGMYGFNNTFGIAVHEDIAKKYNLKTYSDLSKISEFLVFGAEYDFFEREDGYNALKKIYKLDFKSTLDLDIGLKYKAMNEKKIDAMVIFTTDGQLSSQNIVVLEDDKHFYPSYRSGNIIRNEVLKTYPFLKEIFVKLSNSISDSEMAKMNYEVETNKVGAKEVAIKFLKSKNLIN